MGYSREIVHDKTPAEELDYMWDWKNWLDGDSVDSDSWTVDTGLTEIDTAGGASTLRTIWLGGGTAGTTYRVTNTVVTVGGRTAARSFYINVVDAR